MIWSDSYALGVGRIDAQHKGLFTMTNRILRILAEKDSERTRRACMEAIKYLENYALTHFADEEAYQLSVGYPDYERHKQAHDDFTKGLVGMEQDMVDNQFSPDSVQRFVGALTSWLVHHIMNMDQAIVNHAPDLDPALRRDPGLLLQRVMMLEEKALFGDELSILDSSYEGDYSGSEQFIAVDCQTSDGRRVCTLAALPSTFSLRLARQLLGDSVEKMDQLVTATIQNLFSLVVARFAENLYEGAHCEITRIQGLSYRELPFLLAGGQPMCRILFGSEVLGTFEIRAWQPA